jgi:hypothetical protein
MTEPATPQEPTAADKPLPEGVIGVIPRAGAPAVGAGIVSPTGQAIRAKVEAEKAAQAPQPCLVITISIFPDGTRTVDSKAADEKPVALGLIRKVFKECCEHYEDRLMAHMVQVEVRRVVAEAARATKDRNLLARLFHSLG